MELDQSYVWITTRRLNREPARSSVRLGDREDSPRACFAPTSATRPTRTSRRNLDLGLA